MSAKPTIRAAVAQFHVGADIDKNLETCLRMLDQAAECKPDLIVLPEFCNHLSWYDDQEQCVSVSIKKDSAFLAAIASKAKEIGAYVVCNVTLIQENGSVTGTSLLYAPNGECLGDNTKQIYIGHENDFLTRADRPATIFDTAVGRLGMFACMDGVICETPRALALAGAQIICNSINSFATDEGDLHIPVRAAENKVFVVAANKVGPLVPELMVPALSEATGIPEKFLSGAGESQIVAPDGTVLAIASMDQEEVVYADIKLADADRKTRPDGTDIMQSRRPELYQAIVENPLNQQQEFSTECKTLTVATLAPAVSRDVNELSELVQALDPAVQFIVVPPLLDQQQAQNDQTQSIKDSAAHINALSNSLRDDQYLATSLALPARDGYRHAAVLISNDGVVFSQGQVHASQRFAWSTLDDGFSTVELAGIRIGLVTTDDSYYPETFRLLAMQGVQLAMVSMAPLEGWEFSTGLIERAAENRIAIAAACEPSELGNSIITHLENDFTILTQWDEREFDGRLSRPPVSVADSKLLVATINPANAAHKIVSRNTDLLGSRPWDLCQIIAAPNNTNHA